MSHVCENPGVEGGGQTDVLMAQRVGKTAESQGHIKSRKAPREGEEPDCCHCLFAVCWGPVEKNQEPRA